MLSHKFKFIFYHNPRTGGTSIGKALGDYCEYNLESNNPPTEFRKHTTLVTIKNIIGEDKFNEYYKFSFVRNPWDRLLSLYNWGVHICHLHFADDVYERDQIPIKMWRNTDFLTWGKDIFFKMKLFQKRKHWGPQLPFLMKDSHLLVDYIGKFEEIESSFRNILKILGFNVNLPHIYASPVHAKGYNFFYDDELKCMTESLFKEDIEYFNYSY